jgi:AcrR family transcriptional regulator
VVHFFSSLVPYRPTPRTEARRAQTRERIVAAALDQVAQGGYASAAVQAVARRADVATGTVYRHFPSKDDLFAEVFGRASDRELAVLREIAADAGRPALQRLAAGVEALCRRALAGPVLAYAQIAEPVDARVDEERLRLRRGYRDVFAALLREAVAAGEVAPLDVDVAASGITGGVGEALVGPLAARDGRRHEALVASLVNFAVNAVGGEVGHGHAHARSAAHA